MLIIFESLFSGLFCGRRLIYLEMYRGMIETWITRPLQSNKQCLKTPRFVTKLVLLGSSRYTSVKLDSAVLPLGRGCHGRPVVTAHGGAELGLSDTEERLLVAPGAVPTPCPQRQPGPAVPGAACRPHPAWGAASVPQGPGAAPRGGPACRPAWQPPRCNSPAQPPGAAAVRARRP